MQRQLKKQEISRRQFLSLAALGSAGTLLAACGGGQTAVPEPTAVVPPTAAPSLTELGEGVEVMAKDVLDFALETNDWSGQFGWVKFRLNEGRHNGEPIYFIRTDSSDQTYATENGLVFVPLLNQGQSIAKPLYVFSNEDLPPVLGSAPSDADYISLFHIIEVNITDPRAGTGSAADVETAVADGYVETTETGVYVNYPVVKWAGGELAVDDELTATLGNGQLVEPIDTAAMTVNFKLHQCYPGSRYILTDTSSAGMAPMMSVPASEPTQALMESGGTDEIWVFANGIPGSGVMGFQPAIFDNKAGQAAWSPFWNHFTLSWVDESQARVLTSSAEIRELLASGELEQFNGVPDSHPNGFVVNCPAPILAPNTFAG
ncbi:twin-arginine translocation signal domain-containing protein [Candidatus Leptofilum sp.]|uniref:twin-arginine translocation signal domain-containing protein n=1 Tax=Candidatus Leptofilum sp. TaxID=3241576 RepID=UPI003B5CAD4E